LRSARVSAGSSAATAAAAAPRSIISTWRLILRSAGRLQPRRHAVGVGPSIGRVSFKRPWRCSAGLVAIVIGYARTGKWISI
jgi:hypothetical protein